MKLTKIALACLILVGFLYQSNRSSACGPFMPRPVFTLTRQPDPPLDKFAKGELGVLQRGYARSYLFVAYRYLSGNGLDAEEQQTVAKLWGSGRGNSFGPMREAWRTEWLSVRKRVQLLPAPVQWLNVSRALPGEQTYGWYLNCTDDAFRTAAKTLRTRIEKFGPDSAEVKDWVRAQDLVFKNCSEGRVIPASYAGNDPLLRADRAYQIAAAHFYAEDFDEAERLFVDIAQDASSPWRDTASYLVARALVRKGTLGAPPGEVDKVTLARAEKQLDQILADARLSEIHPAALRLKDFARLRLYPEKSFEKLARDLQTKGGLKNLTQAVTDYLFLMGRIKLEHPDDMTDWILTFKSNSPEALSHAVDKWKASATLPWLAAAVSKAGVLHPLARELMAAAERVPVDSPAFPTVTYHRMRLLVESGEKDAARQALDGVLAKRASALPISSRNLFESLRLRVSNNLDDFLKYSVRETAGSTDYGLEEQEAPARPPSGKTSEDAETRQLRFDPLASRILNERMPLSILTRVVQDNPFPPAIQRDLLQAVWVRAVLLDNHKIGGELGPALATSIPVLREFLQAYETAPHLEAKRFAAALLLLKSPGLRPYVTSGFDRHTPVNELDSLRENWWCPLGLGIRLDAPNYFRQYANDWGAETLQRVFPQDQAGLPEILSPSEKGVAQEEWNKLVLLGAAPNFLAQQVLAWAEAHPDDPRVSEALHRTVRATRLGCGDKETSKYSKAAFQFLHRHYPTSEWAKKTKYWY